MKKYIALKNCFADKIDPRQVEMTLGIYMKKVEEINKYLHDQEYLVWFNVATYVYRFSSVPYTGKRYLIDVPMAVIQLAEHMEIKLSTCVSAIYLLVKKEGW